MNPVREEEEIEAEVVRPWRSKNTNSKVKTLASKKKNKLNISRPNSNLGREQIEKILETYDFQKLHDRIMKKILE